MLYTWWFLCQLNGLQTWDVWSSDIFFGCVSGMCIGIHLTWIYRARRLVADKDLGLRKKGYCTWLSICETTSFIADAKIKVMELIDKYEPTRRGPYGGSIEGISYSGDMDIALGHCTMIFPTRTRYDTMCSYKNVSQRWESFFRSHNS